MKPNQLLEKVVRIAEQVTKKSRDLFTENERQAISQFLSRMMKKYSSNPLFTEKGLMNDAITVTEQRFKKPYKTFGDKEHAFLHALYNKTSDPRISLKIYPDTTKSKKEDDHIFRDREITLPTMINMEILRNPNLQTRSRKRKKI